MIKFAFAKPKKSRNRYHIQDKRDNIHGVKLILIIFLIIIGKYVFIDNIIVLLTLITSDLSINPEKVA